MANTFAANATLAFNTNPPTKSGPDALGGRVRILRDTVTYAAQASADTITVGGGFLPIGAVVIGGFLNTSASTSTATLAVGSTASASKYKAAGVVTTTDVPQWFGIATATNGTPLTVAEQIILTVGTAALPASGTLDVVILYVVD